MAVPVTVFNASSQTITIVVNNGPQVTVNGTGAAQGWQPQFQVPSMGPSYSPGYAAMNVIGNLGMNRVQAFVNGVPVGGGPFRFSLPTNYPVSSVQLFLFFASVQTASWMILTDGKVCAQQYGLSQIDSMEFQPTIALTEPAISG